MLKEKTALITGASRGIGKAIAILFAQNGAYVGINYRKNKTDAQRVLNTILKNGGNGIPLQGDISDLKDVQNMVHILVEQRKSIDILVNNAGIYQRSNFESITTDQWRQVLAVNLTGCYHLCLSVYPYMKAGGRIIFVSSQLALKGSSHGADYAASKAGILGLMRSLALEYAKENITVNAVAPGTIDTDLIADYTDEMRKQRSCEIPLGRLGLPEDVANACLFLASNLSDYITGETINVNGGLYIQ